MRSEARWTVQGRHDIRHNNIQHNDTHDKQRSLITFGLMALNIKAQHNNTQLNDTA
jgi:hypothetical protein